MIVLKQIPALPTDACFAAGLVHISWKLRNSLCLPENQATLSLPCNRVINYGICVSAAHYERSVSSSWDNM